MKMIGPIIQNKRIAKGLSRKELSKNICTEKHIYLIETNRRNPSVKMLNKISRRLGIDLFKYYQYLDFEDPMSVMGYKNKFEREIQLSNIKKLKRIADQASKLEAFKSEPLNYDITIINLLYEGIIIKEERKKSREQIKLVLSTAKLEMDPFALIYGYVALSTLYQLDGQLNEAKETLLLACELIEDQVRKPGYQTVYISLIISLLSYYYHENNNEEIIRYGKKILTFQKEENEYNRIYYPEFYLASAYYRTKSFSKSKKHFVRALHAMSLFGNEFDNSIIQTMPIFSEMLKYYSIEEKSIIHFL